MKQRLGIEFNASNATALAAVIIIGLITAIGNTNISAAKEKTEKNYDICATNENYHGNTNGNTANEADTDSIDEAAISENIGGINETMSEKSIGDNTEKSEAKSDYEISSDIYKDEMLSPNDIALMSLYKSSYCDWNAHSWTASYNGSNLILKFDIDFYAIGNGYEIFTPKYDFGYSQSSRMPNDILSCTSSSRVLTNKGKATVTSVSVIPGGAPYDRRMILKGYITVDSKYLGSLTGGRFRYHAGGWKDGDWDAAENGDFTVSNFQTAYNQAKCSHSSWNYTQSDSSKHNVKCSSCGYGYTQAHTLSGGACTKCGYKNKVNVTLEYIFNNRTETENAELVPGSEYKPKTVNGYLDPASVTVPAGGGKISISYIPIEYSIEDGEKEYSLKYDDSLFLPSKERKGYIHKGFIVDHVS